MKPIIYTSPYSLHHNTPEGHPEKATRIEALEVLFASEVFEGWQNKSSQPADLETVGLAHDEDYLFDLQDKTPEAGLVYLDGDTVLSPQSYDAALHGAGAVCDAVDDVISGKTLVAFCAVRPPGHHAEPDKAMGFCLMNNILIAARHAQTKHNIQKVAIIDFDVHHGNGTDVMTRQHNQNHPEQPIFYASTHGHPLFPMTGDPKDNTQYVINHYLPDKCDGEAFRALYEEHIFPALKAYKPDLLLLSSGFDAHKDDPLGHAHLETEDFGWLASNLSDIVDNKNIISVLEGGYDVPSLVSCVQTHLQHLYKAKC